MKRNFLCSFVLFSDHMCTQGFITIKCLVLSAVHEFFFLIFDKGNMRFSLDRCKTNCYLTINVNEMLND